MNGFGPIGGGSGTPGPPGPPGPPGAGASIGPFACEAGVTAGNIVVITSSNAVELADADAAGLYGAVYLVTDKPTATTCNAILSGVAPYYSGLVAGAMYYASTVPGQITNDAAGLIASGASLQKLGGAINSSTLGFQPDLTVLEQ